MSDNPKLNILLKNGAEGDIVVMGVPFNFSRKRSINKGGEDNGPCCLRRFFSKVGPLTNSEYGIDIRGVKVSDYGNVEYLEKVDVQMP